VTYYERENIPFKAPNCFDDNGKEKVSMKLFNRKRHAVKNWHARAMVIDPNKTKITIVKTKTKKQIPLWVYKKYAPHQIPAI
jgi:hypothetical protein